MAEGLPEQAVMGGTLKGRGSGCFCLNYLLTLGGLREHITVPDSQAPPSEDNW